MIRIAAALAVVALAAQAECRDDRVVISGGFGQAAFSVSVADDAGERAQGLMNVPEMPTMTGMIFVYPEPQRASFWMRNTLIPLDMLFADASGMIVTVHADAVPMDETPIPGGDGIQFVLEINGGLAARLGIQPGDAMQHTAIPGSCN